MPPTAQSGQKPSDSGATIHWFRHGLRVHDNPALQEAVSTGSVVYPVFIFDGEVAGTKTAGYNRMRFLRESLVDLDETLQKYGGRLYVFRGDPVEVLTKLFEEWGVETLTFEQDSEAVWKNRDDRVKSLCDTLGVKWVEKISHTLWDPNEIIENNGGVPPWTYMLFNLVAETIGDPPRPVEDDDLTRAKFSVGNDHDRTFGIPSLEDLGVRVECVEQNRRVNQWVGGETQALRLFQNRLQVEQMAFSTGVTMPNQTFPDLTGPPLSMSAYLRFGCLSIRKLYWALRDSFERIQPSLSFSLSVIGQLIWREYFYTMSINNENYNKMKGNPLCLEIPWYEDEEKFNRWKEGRTGFPWIDAIMKQLQHEGWIHHIARNSVSSFLTRGDLWLNWEKGLEVFDNLLLDADWSVCAGNWMWMSSSAFEKAFQCTKCFCPVRFGRKMDPSGAYVRRYLPVLKDMPLRYLFEPWKAPRQVQEQAGCVVGVDYPSPMVDHQEASKECFQKMMAVKESLKDKGDLKLCGPANIQEVRAFCQMEHRHDGESSKGIDPDAICDGLLAL